MDIKQAVIGGVLALLVINGVLYAKPYKAPNLGHPVRWRRWLNRALAYPLCHFFAACLVLALLEEVAPYLPAALARPDRSSTLRLVMEAVVLPLPLALLLLKCAIWTQRVVLGFEHWPMPPATPEAPLPLAWVPPLPRRHDFSTVDLRDPELVRELARSHWRVAHEALEQGTSTAVAEDLQKAFLQDYLSTVEPGLADPAWKVYCEEMAAQASAAHEHAERITSLREHQMRVLTGETEVRD